MRVVAADEIHRLLDIDSLVEALRMMFRRGCEVPVRHHHAVPGQDAAGGTLLLMPAWRAAGPVGIKIVTVFPENAQRGLPSVLGSYLLLDGASGRVLALLDGPSLTLRRTAAASALAAGYLARPDASRHLMVGTGALAPHLIAAHAATRKIRDLRIWGRDPAKAAALARRLEGSAASVEPVADLAAAVAAADIVTCATLAREPLVRGEWLQRGAHLDLVGGYRPDMREADDEAVRRASVFVDTLAGATAEAGDIVQPLASGALAREGIKGDLFALCRGETRGRCDAGEITFFKSVGTALEDLAAAELAYSRLPAE
jgi:ornithine cyclodeaminase